MAIGLSEGIYGNDPSLNVTFPKCHLAPMTKIKDGLDKYRSSHSSHGLRIYVMKGNVQTFQWLLHHIMLQDYFIYGAVKEG